MDRKNGGFKRAGCLRDTYSADYVQGRATVWYTSKTAFTRQLQDSETHTQGIVPDKITHLWQGRLFFGKEIANPLHRDDCIDDLVDQHR